MKPDILLRRLDCTFNLNMCEPEDLRFMIALMKTPAPVTSLLFVFNQGGRSGSKVHR